ncbi:hypothetical protein FHG87_022291 [Trinorchestia longiramus]|nr:hypothetical protein FHG87_022291 [Trinorchestia longiramus]
MGVHQGNPSKGKCEDIKASADYGSSELLSVTHLLCYSRDEKKFNSDGPDGFQYYLHNLRKDGQIFSRRPFGGRSLMIWGAFSEEGNVLCSKISIEDKYVDTTFEGSCTSDAHHQRIGAALSVSGQQIIVCAPNWNNTCVKVPYSGKYSTLVGTCYTSSDVLGPFRNFTPVYYYNTQSPPRYYMKDGYCQAGFSVALLQQESRGVVLGAPGCFSWLGECLYK